MRTKIKICGITNSKNALDAVDLGVDALGFVFFGESPRYIEPKKARKIINLLPSFVLMGIELILKSGSYERTI